MTAEPVSWPRQSNGLTAANLIAWVYLAGMLAVLGGEEQVSIEALQKKRWKKKDSNAAKRWKTLAIVFGKGSAKYDALVAKEPAPTARLHLDDKPSPTMSLGVDREFMAMNEPRLRAAACVTCTGSLFVAGGLVQTKSDKKPPRRLTSVEVYHRSTGSWGACETRSPFSVSVEALAETRVAPQTEMLPSMMSARAGACCAAMPGNCVLVAGGRRGQTAVATCEMYDEDARTWSKFPP